MFIDELKKAFVEKLVQEDFNIRALARRTGVNNSTLNRLKSKKANFENIPALTIQRLFPDIQVFFFGEKTCGEKILVSGVNTAPIANGKHANISISSRNGSEIIFDESTKILLAYWEDLPQSKRFEFLMKLAELKER